MLLGAFLTLMGLGMIAMLVVSLPIGLLSLVAPAAGRLIGSVVVLIGAGFALYASVRLILLNPVALDRPERPLGLLRHGWKMTRGHFWRLLAFMGMIGVVMLVVSETAQIVLGAIFGLIGGKEMAVAVGGIASAVATTIVQIYIVVMLARIYRQLEG
jgi:membrane-anchored glycerophosphoryl diester phosphodiesterase (GDPDase)